MVTNVKAFPNMTNQTGMDLRDYFAAKALPVVFKMIAFNHKRNLGSDFEWTYDEEEFEVLADMSYGIADAMMKARETKPDEYQTQSAPTSRQPSDPSSW